MNKILVLGATGQDGAVICEYYLTNGYIVHGTKRRASLVNNTQRVNHLRHNPNFHLHYLDITDFSNILELVTTIKPNYIFNTTAQSHVQVSFKQPIHTLDVDAKGVLNLLEAVRQSGIETRIMQFCTSEMFGNTPPPQNEDSPFKSESPYAAAKIYAYHICKHYRNAYNMFICTAISFNHTDYLRTENFIEKKIVCGLVNIKKLNQQCLYLGNLNSKRDIGWSRDFILGWEKMIKHEKPDDFVFCTGQSYSIRQMVEIAAKHVGMKIKWEGAGIDEVGIDNNTGNVVVRIDERYFRPSDIDELRGDYTKAELILDWKPKMFLPKILKEMVQYEIAKI